MLSLLLAGCGGDAAPPSAGSETGGVATPSGAAAAEDVGAASTEAAVGEWVYAPVYSHIFFQDEGRQIDLAATLSVRNTDTQHPINLTSAVYYDSGGRLVRRYGEEAVVLPPLSSRAYVVEERDRTGGVGANFLIA